MDETSRHSSSRSRVAGGRRHHVPPGTGTLGMWLFLAALTMLFGASIIGYLIMRARLSSDVDLPAGLWASTGILLISSFTMHRALQNVRAERQTRFRNSLLITLLLAVAFLLVQGPGMVELLGAHQQQLDISESLYALVFFLVMVHALHILGGLIPLFVVTVQAHRNRYDHESHGPIQWMTMYWHFLDGVWVVMFLVLKMA